MLPPKDQLTICFAHGAYRMAERFAARATGIRHVQVFNSDQLTQQLPEADVLVVSMMWRNQQVDIARKLKFIQSISAGVDQYDRDLLRARGIRLASAAGVNAQAVAEHAMALILALRRKLHISRDNQAARFWRPMAPDIASREEPLPAASPLWAMPNVVLTSHVAGETQRYEDSVIDILLENLERLWRDETALRNQIA